MKTELEPFALPPMEGARVLLVIAPYYREVAAHLEAGARAAIAEAQADVEVVNVPGAFEIPGAIAQVAYSSVYDAYVGLGCVVRGETSHYDYVCGESARGLMDLSLQGFPIGYGILTVDTIEQAQARADPARGNKGGEAVRAALAILALKRRYADADR
jgi:6,7-dimethyl-8-ribityllumazine synthase